MIINRKLRHTFYGGLIAAGFFMAGSYLSSKSFEIILQEQYRSEVDECLLNARAIRSCNYQKSKFAQDRLKWLEYYALVHTNTVLSEQGINEDTIRVFQGVKNYCETYNVPVQDDVIKLMLEKLPERTPSICGYDES